MKLRRRGQSSHSQFELNASSVTAWANKLPRANLAESSKQLYRALDELSSLDCSFRQRLETLEALRPPIHLILQGLQPRYLNASIVLPEKTAAVVRLCNRFNNFLADNYRLATEDILSHSWTSRFRQSLALAVHRELTERSVLLLRSYLLYQIEPSNTWEQLHRCYQIGSKHKLNAIRVDDPCHGSCTVEQAYLRPMLFVGAHPYQMSQQAQLTLHTALHQLCAKARIQTSDPRKCCFLFNPLGNQPPIYQELCDDTEGFLGIDTSDLIELLSEQVRRGKNDNSKLPPQLCMNLLDAWSSISDRFEERHAEKRNLDLTVGLSSTHFFVAGEQPLEAFNHTPSYDNGDGKEHSLAAKGSKSRPQKSSLTTNPVEEIDYSGSQQQHKKTKANVYRHFPVQTVNVSRRGYYIAWPATESTQLRNGEVLGLRENDAPCWSVGCVRWIKKHSEEELHVGIEILSPAAESYVARLSDHEQPYRALLLGAESTLGTPSRLLLPNISVSEGSELELTQPAGSFRLQLKQQLSSTRDFAVYEYDASAKENSDKPSQEDSTNEEFSELWESL